jgi:ankyrin repeat protein
MKKLLWIFLLTLPVHATGWHDAAENGNLEAVKSLLAGDASLLNSVDHEGETALMEAAEEGREEVVRFLLERGAAVDTQDAEGETALMEAVEAGHETVTRLLLRAGSPVGTLDHEGRNAEDRAESPELKALFEARRGNARMSR